MWQVGAPLPSHRPKTPYPPRGAYLFASTLPPSALHPTLTIACSKLTWTNGRGRLISLVTLPVDWPRHPLLYILIVASGLPFSSFQDASACLPVVARMTILGPACGASPVPGPCGCDCPWNKKRSVLHELAPIILSMLLVVASNCLVFADTAQIHT